MRSFEVSRSRATPEDGSITERPASAKVAGPKSAAPGAKAAAIMTAREPYKDVLVASRRRTVGGDTLVSAPKDVTKKKVQGMPEQAVGRTPRDSSSPNGGAATSTSPTSSTTVLAVQPKNSPQRKRMPFPDEEVQPASASFPMTASAASTSGGAASTQVAAGSPAMPLGVVPALPSTSPRGEATSSNKVKELESRLPPEAKVRELESRLSASTKAQVREVEARLPSGAKARMQATPSAKAQTSPTSVCTVAALPRGFRSPPGLELDNSAEVSGETDSFDEEVELLRCQADLVEAAVELGTTSSADDDFFTTDPDVDDEVESMGVLLSRPSKGWQRPSVASVVIEEDEEGISDHSLDDGIEVFDGSEMRSRLWAQSLLRLKRSIDEIYSLCEYESDEVMCGKVKEILLTASQDFVALVKRFETQQEYALLPGEFPLKTGVAWTTRTPKATRCGESALEVLERAQSPGSASSRSKMDLTRKADLAKRRSSSLEPQKNRTSEEPAHEIDAGTGSQITTSGGTGEALGGLPEMTPLDNLFMRGEDQLQSMVQSALQRIQSRLGKASKPNPEEVLKRSEDRQRRAQQLRAEQEEQRLLHMKSVENRVWAAREKRQQREQQMQVQLLEKMTRARRQYQDHLRVICERARNENRKSAEVAYITKEAVKGERDRMRRKQENAHLARALLREQMRKRLIQSANRVAKVSENKRRQQEMWQHKVLQDLEEKERLASARRKEHIHSIRVKSQEKESVRESVREKRREIQEEDEKFVQQQQQAFCKDFLHFRNIDLARLALRVEGLPDGGREEGAMPQTAAGSQTGAARGNVRAHARRSKTPPRRPQQSESLKSSPKSDAIATEMSDIDEDVGLAAARQPSSSSDNKASKPKAKLQASAKCSTSAVDHNDLPAAAARLSLGDSSHVQDIVSAGGGGSEDEPAEDVVAPEREGTDDEPISEHEGSDVGESAIALVDPMATWQTSMLTTPRVSDNAGATKGSLRPKSKSDAKDTRHRRATSPPDASGNADSDQTGFATMPDGQYLETLRKQLSLESLSDEEALKVSVRTDGSRTAAVNAAHRARISKLATDLCRVVPLLGNTLGNACSAVAEDSAGQQLGAHSLDLERADTVLSDFCKVLDQSQREADYALVLQLGCVGKVMDICSRIKDSMGAQSLAAERNMPPAMKQLSSVMLSALKWLGLLSKQKISRVFLLLTNRVVLLADVAVAGLATTPVPETQSMASLFLPQVLHVLSLLVKQTLPEGNDSFRQKLISYLLVCGLPEKLRDLFKGAGLRGMRLFDGASPMPLLLLRAMCFLGTLVNSYRLPSDPSGECCSANPSEDKASAVPILPVLQVLRRTDLFGIVSVLGAILCPEKGKPPTSVQVARLPQTVISLAVQAMRILNNTARIHLETLQEALGARQHELHNLLVCLLDYCALHQGAKPVQGQGQDESELLHETVTLLGFYCLFRDDHQGVMCYGEGQTLLAKITSLPQYYFMDERGKLLLFPTILATCFRSEQNLELLRSEINLSLLRNFLAALLAQKDDARLPEAAAIGFGGRFPQALWQDALDFFKDEAASLSPSD